MSEVFTLLSWNCQDKAPALMGEITRYEAEVIILPEAFAESSADDPEVLEGLRRACEGYDCTPIPYEDDDNRLDRHVMLVLTKPSLQATVLPIRFGGRTMAAIFFESMAIIGVHLDDRSEATRRIQTAAILEYLECDCDANTMVVAGDFNAAHPGTKLGRALYQARPFIGRLPMSAPGSKPTDLVGKLRYFSGRPGSLMSRLLGMTQSHVLDFFELAGFEDADPKHLPTKKFGQLPAVQLDHVMVKGLAADAIPVIKAKGSDHYPVTAYIW